MKLCIIDYGSGNLRSAQKAFEKSAQSISGAEVLLTNKPEDLDAADRIILPGVGAFGDCRDGLFKVDGLVEALQTNVIQKAKPFFGICVGMQLLAQSGEEKGTHRGLGWIEGKVGLMQPDDKSLKIPQMGWNTLAPTQTHPVLDGLELGATGKHAYFVHSYQFNATNPENVLATTQYGGVVTAMVGRDNIIGTQFHPEKSQGFGLQLIENFLNWKI